MDVFESGKLVVRYVDDDKKVVEQGIDTPDRPEPNPDNPNLQEKPYEIHTEEEVRADTRSWKLLGLAMLRFHSPLTTRRRSSTGFMTTHTTNRRPRMKDTKINLMKRYTGI
jgi:hypothetical protein